MGEDVKCKYNGNRLCTPEPMKPKLSSLSLLEDEKMDLPEKTTKSGTGEHMEQFVEVEADRYSWTWILFDKRVEYECNPVLSGSSVAFRMDIDVWKKSVREIKQNEESQSIHMNDILSGQLNVDMNIINGVDDNPDYYRQETNGSSPTYSANLVFNPYRDEIVDYVMNRTSE